MTAQHTLTPKQEGFAQAYVETGNATEAYRRSGYSWRNMNENTLNRVAFAALNHAKISARIQVLQDRIEKKHNVTVDRLVRMHLKAYRVAEKTEKGGQMTAAATNLGKLLGYHEQKLRHTVDQPLTVEIVQFSALSENAPLPGEKVKPDLPAPNGKGR